MSEESLATTHNGVNNSLYHIKRILKNLPLEDELDIHYTISNRTLVELNKYIDILSIASTVLFNALVDKSKTKKKITSLKQNGVPMAAKKKTAKKITTKKAPRKTTNTANKVGRPAKNTK